MSRFVVDLCLLHIPHRHLGREAAPVGAVQLRAAASPAPRARRECVRIHHVEGHSLVACAHRELLYARPRFHLLGHDCLVGRAEPDPPPPVRSRAAARRVLLCPRAPPPASPLLCVLSSLSPLTPPPFSHCLSLSDYAPHADLCGAVTPHHLHDHCVCLLYDPETASSSLEGDYQYNVDNNGTLFAA